MQIVTSGVKSNNLIGQRYEVLSTPTQTSHWQTLAPNIPNIEIKVLVKPLFSAELPNELHQNSILLARCLTLISMLFVTSKEALQEASTALEGMVEYYKNTPDSQQISLPLPQNLGEITGNVLPSVVRPPLILDFE